MNHKMNQLMSDITFDEITRHLLYDNVASGYFNGLGSKLKCYPLSMLQELKNVEQSPIYHPEGNVWNHTMRIIDL